MQLRKGECDCKETEWRPIFIDSVRPPMGLEFRKRNMLNKTSFDDRYKSAPFCFSIGAFIFGITFSIASFTFRITFRIARQKSHYEHLRCTLAANFQVLVSANPISLPPSHLLPRRLPSNHRHTIVHLPVVVHPIKLFSRILFLRRKTKGFTTPSPSPRPSDSLE